MLRDKQITLGNTLTNTSFKKLIHVQLAVSEISTELLLLLPNFTRAIAKK